MSTDTIYDQTRAIIAGVLQRKVSLADFATWVYETSHLSAVIGLEEEEQLLGFDYLASQSYTQLDPLLLAIYERLDPVAYQREHIRRLLCGLATSQVNLISACGMLAYYQHHGHAWLPIIFAGLDSELDAAPRWLADQDPFTLEQYATEAAPWLTAYQQSAQNAAKQTLQTYFADVPCTSNIAQAITTRGEAG